MNDGKSPAEVWDTDVNRHMLDELFKLTHRYRSSSAYFELMRFVARFRHYAPFNAMLVSIQMPGARYVAPPSRWEKAYKRRIKPNAHPLVILQPKGPVMFVFDVSDTDPDEGAPPLPREILNPFDVRGGTIRRELELTIQNAARDGVRVHEQKGGSQGAGRIRSAEPGRFLKVAARLHPTPEYLQIPVRYELILNSELSREATYATLAHELAHLYCGHLGTPNSKWWPDRRGLNPPLREFEAESASYIVCRRRGIETPSEEYLSGYARRNATTPSISLECVMKAAGLVDQMGRERLRLRGEARE